ncbi:LAQU0S18e00386g1_1 [Lachancea quebecensis]|uniref:LAQU0S18e00386g1_1 n=1 Tax=Lachancea quebecensis TaxID=1654605 RepID=A0A0P1KWY7_9SACH|nr:LAQU0S18e00386g1_1 [Lachancea quebecensis]
MAGASVVLAVGVAVGVVSSATQSVGLTLQRKASVAHAASRGRRSLYRSGTWQLGFALFLLANIVGSTVQIATLPLIVLAPLQSCGLLFNSLAAHYLLKERSTWLTVAATLLVILGGMVVGVVGVSSSSSLDTITHSLAQLLRLAHQRLFLHWFAFTNAAVVLALAATSCYARVLPAVVKGVVCGCCSGTWSAHSLLMAKSISDVVSHAVLQDAADLRTLGFWLLVLAFVSLALTQLFLLNKGLRHISTSVLYPLVFCVYNLINIFNGLAFYHPPDTPLARVLAVMLPGAASLVLGVVLLSRDQYNMFQHENAAATSDPSRRTSTLSYTSLRPQSMDLSSLQSAPLSADDSDAFYISLPQATRKDKYGSVNSSKRNSRRVLSYEQEGILTQMA